MLHQASLAGLAELDRLDEEDPHAVSDSIRDRVRRRDFAAWERVSSSPDETPSEIYARRRKSMIDEERRRVLEIRSTGTVAHEVLDEVLGMLDIEESMLDYSEGERERMRSSGTIAGMTLAGDCDHLRSPGPPVEPDTPGRVRRLPARGDGLGAPAHVCHLRPHRLLRLLAAAACERAPRGDRSPGDALGRAG